MKKGFYILTLIAAVAIIILAGCGTATAGTESGDNGSTPTDTPVDAPTDPAVTATNCDDPNNWIPLIFGEPTQVVIDAFIYYQSFGVYENKFDGIPVVNITVTGANPDEIILYTTGNVEQEPAKFCFEYINTIDENTDIGTEEAEEPVEFVDFLFSPEYNPENSNLIIEIFEITESKDGQSLKYVIDPTIKGSNIKHAYVKYNVKSAKTTVSTTTVPVQNASINATLYTFGNTNTCTSRQSINIPPASPLSYPSNISTNFELVIKRVVPGATTYSLAGTWVKRASDPAPVATPRCGR